MHNCMEQHITSKNIFILNLKISIFKILATSAVLQKSLIICVHTEAEGIEYRPLPISQNASAVPSCDLFL